MMPMEPKPRSSQLRAPFISLAVAITVIFILVTIVFLFGYLAKVERDKLRKIERRRELYGIDLEKARETIERSYRLLAGGYEDAYQRGLSEPKSEFDRLDDIIGQLKDPPFAEPYLLRARIYIILRDLDKADADLAKYIELKPPAYSMAYVDRVTVASLRFLRLALADASAAELRKIGDPADEEIEKFCTWWTDGLKRELDAPNVIPYWNASAMMGFRQLLKNQSFGKASEWFDNIYGSTPDPITFRALRSLANLRFWHHMQNRLKEQAGMPETLDLEQERAITRETLADLQEMTKEALVLCPNHPEFLALRGHVLLATREFAGALKCFEDAKNADAAFNLANYGIALVHLAKGDADKALDALKAYTIAEQAQPKPLLTSGVHRAYARAHALKGESDEALKKYSSAVALDPSSPDIHVERAALLAKAGKFADAEADLSYVLDTHGDDLEARLARVDVYIGMGDKAKALADLDKAKQTNAKRKFGRDAQIKEKRERAEKLPSK
jgi:tetratricopeptide (TPR) repeat protein